MQIVIAAVKGENSTAVASDTISSFLQQNDVLTTRWSCKVVAVKNFYPLSMFGFFLFSFLMYPAVTCMH